MKLRPTSPPQSRTVRRSLRAAILTVLCFATVFATAATAYADGPFVIITSPAQGSQVQGTSTDVSFDLDEGDYPPVTTTCRVDSDSWVPCSSPWTTPTLTEGTHTLQVGAEDSIGQLAGAAVSVTFDATPPDTTIDSHPAPVTSQIVGSFTFSSEDENATFECNVDDAGWTACSSPFTLTGLVAGSHSFAVRASDGVGNVDPTPAEFDWVIDLTPPATTITDGPAANVATTSASLSFESNEPGTFECRLDSPTWTPCASPVNYSGLGQGAHQFFVRAVDAAGNRDASPEQRNWNVDSVAPDPPVITAPVNGTRLPTLTPQISGTSEASATITVFDGATQLGTTTADGSGVWSFTPSSPLTEAAHTFTATATDALGNTSAASTAVSVTLDVTFPQTAIDAHPPAVSVSSSAQFSFSSTDPTATFECSIDGGGFTACSSPRNYAGLADGARHFEVRAVDPAGNADATPATFDWTIDTTGPVVTITGFPAANSTAGTFLFTANEPVDKYECRIDSGAYNECSPPIFVSGLSAGAHVFRVRATDVLGNVTEPVAMHNWVIDLTDPLVPTISSPANNSWTSDNTPTVTGSAEANGSVRVYDNTALLAIVPVNGSGAWSYTPASPLTDRAYAIRARAVDQAGNWSGYSPIVNLNIDTVLPSAPVIVNPANGGATNDSTPTVNGTTEPYAAIAVAVDGTPVATVNANAAGNWTTTVASPLSEGSHNFTAIATDRAANTGPQASNTATVDTIAPAVPAITSPPGGSVFNDTSVEFQGTGEPDTSVAILRGGTQIGTAAVDGTGDWNYVANDQPDGDFAYSARGFDAAGNQSAASAAVDVRVDTTAPVVQFTATPAAITNDPTSSFTLSVSEGDVEIFCWLDDDPPEPCTADVDLPALPAGDYSFTAYAVDSSGNTGEQTTFNWTIDLTPPGAPQIESPASPATVTDSTPTVSGSAEAGASVRVYANGSPSGSLVPVDGNGDWSWTPAAALAQGAQTLTARAIDPAGNASGDSPALNLTVDSIAPTTSFTAGPPALTKLTFATISFNSSDGSATFECSLDGAAWAACTSPRSLNSLTEGAHTFAVRAGDTAGNLENPPAQRSWTIDTSAPVGSSSVVADSADASGTPSFSIDSSDSGATTACQIDDGAFAACSTPFRPAGLAPGQHTLTVRYTDAAGNESSQTITFSVTPPVQPPTEQPPAQCLVSGEPVGSAPQLALVSVKRGARGQTVFTIRSNTAGVARLVVTSGDRRVGGAFTVLKRGRVSVAVKLGAKPAGELTLRVSSVATTLGHGIAEIVFRSAGGGSYAAQPGATFANSTKCAAEPGAITARAKLSTLNARKAIVGITSRQFAVVSVRVPGGVWATAVVQPGKQSKLTLRSAKPLPKGPLRLETVVSSADGVHSVKSAAIRVR